MSLASQLSTAIFCTSLLWFTGCVGPMACGPGGGCGPIAFGTSCDGCGECEGCGELYIDPWINHPADCCDPCDQCGNYNGQSCGKCRSIFDGIESLWGYRCDTGCNDCGVASCGGGCGLSQTTDCCGSTCGGCDSCSGGCDSSCGGCDSCSGGCGASCGGCDSCSGGGLVQISSEPTPAKRIVEAKPAEAPYKPQRTRKIFQPRREVASGPPKSSDY